MTALHQNYEVETIDDLDHVHDDDCRECAREGCGDLTCQHEDGEGPGLRPDSLCSRWLADGDCEICDGHGVRSEDVDTGRRTLERDVNCYACGGTGSAR